LPGEPSLLQTRDPGVVSAHRIPFNRPSVSAAATACVADVLQSHRLAGIGPVGMRCERWLEEQTGTRRALLTPSCTHALEMAAHLIDAETGDEVLVPSFTFVSTANAFAMRGLTPVFADVSPGTLNVNVDHLVELVTARTRAVVPMHYAGVACDMDALTAFAARHGLQVIEDNAHGLFGTYKGRPLGTFGNLTTQSFDETKNITCGQGGALLVNDPSLIDRAEILRHRGTNRARFTRGEVDKYTWVDAGSNWVLSEVHAAMLWGHLAGHSTIQASRQRIWSRYHQGLRAWAQAHGVRQPDVPPYAGHPAHLYYLILPTPEARTRLIQHLGAHSIQAVFHYVPLHASPMGRSFGGRDGDCPVAEDLSSRLIRLPFYDTLSAADQDDVIETVLSFTP
jgi:dTDP-4-amino-4,6-dideoxygalactose transaminase